MTKEKVDATIYFLSFHNFISHFLLKKELLHGMDSSFMRNMLSNLNQSHPIMRSKLFLTIRALTILLHKLNNFHHFDLHLIIELVLIVHFYLHSF